MPGAATRRCVRLRIEGRVQGVGFRAWVERKAVDLGLDGWVRNRRDGGVETVVSGSTEIVDRMIASCRRGPSAARVDAVKVLEDTEQVGTGFVVRPTV